MTGATGGVGKDIALGLGEAGATVYVTGRSLNAGDDLRGSLSRTVAEIGDLGGVGVAARRDRTSTALTRVTLANTGPGNRDRSALS